MVRRDRARTHHAARGFEGEIEHRGEVNIESEGAAVLSDQLAVLAEEFAIAGGEYIRRRGRWPEHVAKSVYAAAFEVDAGEQRRGNAFLAIAQEAPGLLGALDVACEQDHSCWLQTREQGTEARRHLCAVEADDQELADGLSLRSGFLAVLPLISDFFLQLRQQIQCLQRREPVQVYFA